MIRKPYQYAEINLVDSQKLFKLDYVIYCGWAVKYAFLSFGNDCLLSHKMGKT